MRLGVWVIFKLRPISRRKLINMEIKSLSVYDLKLAVINEFRGGDTVSTRNQYIQLLCCCFSKVRTLEECIESWWTYRARTDRRSYCWQKKLWYWTHKANRVLNTKRLSLSQLFLTAQWACGIFLAFTTSELISSFLICCRPVSLSLVRVSDPINTEFRVFTCYVQPLCSVGTIIY